MKSDFGVVSLVIELWGGTFDGRRRRYREMVELASLDVAIPGNFNSSKMPMMKGGRNPHQGMPCQSKTSICEIQDRNAWKPLS